MDECFDERFEDDRRFLDVDSSESLEWLERSSSDAAEVPEKASS